MKQLLDTKIKRESGKLYFCKTSKIGTLIVCETSMAKHVKRRKKK